MVGLEGVGVGGPILRDDFEDTHAGTSKEKGSTDSNWRDEQKREHI